MCREANGFVAYQIWRSAILIREVFPSLDEFLSPSFVVHEKSHKSNGPDNTLSKQREREKEGESNFYVYISPLCIPNGRDSRSRSMKWRKKISSRFTHSHSLTTRAHTGENMYIEEMVHKYQVGKSRSLLVCMSLRALYSQLFCIKNLVSLTFSPFWWPIKYAPVWEKILAHKSNQKAKIWK